MTQDQQTKIVDPRVTGAIFDFAAWLTTQPQTRRIGAEHDASPMADAIKEWAEMRGLEIEQPEPDVLGWQDKDLYRALELAWGLIANAGGGDWSRESDEWRAAAMRWRDEQWFPLVHIGSDEVDLVGRVLGRKD